MYSIESDEGDDLAEVSTTRLVEMARRIGVLLAGREAPMSGVAAAEVAEALGQVMDLFEAALAPLVRRVDVLGAAGECGFPSTSAWVRSQLGMRHGRAVERVCLARQLSRLDKTAERFAGGKLSFGQASVITSAVSRFDDGDAELAEGALLGLVDAGHSVGELAKDAARITELIDQQRGGESEPDDSRRGFRRSWVSVNRSLDGGAWVRGWLTSEHAALFEETVGPLAKPANSADDRDHAQRTADALFSVVSEGNRGAGVTIVVDLAAYTRTTGDTGLLEPTSYGTGAANDDLDPPAHSPGAHSPGAQSPGAQSPGAQSPGARSEDGIAEGADVGQRCPPLPGQARPAARLLNGTPISAARARQIALTAGINALILGPSGSPLYLGRTVRLATAAQRKALLALYDTCCVKGCDIPAHLCEIHHLGGGWKFGTPTNIDNLVPTCGFHNQWIESHGDRVEEHSDAEGRAFLTLRRPGEVAASQAA